MGVANTIGRWLSLLKEKGEDREALLLKLFQAIGSEEPNTQMVRAATREYGRKELLDTRLRVIPPVSSIEMS